MVKAGWPDGSMKEQGQGIPGHPFAEQSKLLQIVVFSFGKHITTHANSGTFL